MTHRRFSLYLAPLAAFLAPSSAFAQCPICALAAGAGIGIAKKFGIDDLVTGAWVGALIIAFAIWNIKWFQKRSIRFFARDPITVLAWFLMTLLPLQWMGYIGMPLNDIFGMDRLLVGIIAGSIVFFIGHIWYIAIKKRNGGHAWFPLQKVVWPVGLLLILSVLLFFIAKLFPTLL